jgi:uncharacterized membrane protein
MAGGKPTRNVPNLPQGRGTLAGRAANDGPGPAGSQVPADRDPVTERVDTQSPTAEATPGKPVEAPMRSNRFKFAKLPSWALAPRAVVICLAVIIAAGVIILLVLSAQWPGPR